MLRQQFVDTVAGPHSVLQSVQSGPYRTESRAAGPYWRWPARLTFSTATNLVNKSTPPAAKPITFSALSPLRLYSGVSILVCLGRARREREPEMSL